MRALRLVKIKGGREGWIAGESPGSGAGVEGLWNEASGRPAMAAPTPLSTVPKRWEAPEGVRKPSPLQPESGCGEGGSL